MSPVSIPLRHLLPALTLSAGVLVLVVSCWMDIHEARRTLVDNADRRARTLSRLVASDVEPVLRSGHATQLSVLMSNANVARDLDSALLLDREGRVIAANREGLAREDRLVHPDAVSGPLEAAISTGTQSSASVGDLLVVVTPVVQHTSAAVGTAAGPHYLVMIHDLAPAWAAIRVSTAEQAMFMVGVLLVLCALSWMLLRWHVLSRLSFLHEASRRFAAGELDTRFSLRGGDELASIGQSLEAMARRIERQTRQQREQEARLRTSMESAGQGTWQWDLQSGCLEIDPDWCARQGFRTHLFEDGLGHVLDRIDEIGSAGLEKALAEHLAGRQPELLQELSWTPPDGGQRRHYLIRGSVTERDEAGDPLRMHGLIQDQSELRTQTAAAHRFERLIEESDTEFYVMDAQTLRFEYVNGAVERHLGYSRDELLGRTPDLFRADLEKGATREFVDELMTRTGAIRTTNSLHRRKDGSVYDVELVLQSVEIDERRLILATAIDVSDRNEARRMEANLRALVETNPLPIGVLEPDGRPRYLNPAARELFSFPQNLSGGSDDLGDTWTDRETRRFRQKVLPEVAAGRPWAGTLSFRDRRGRRRILEARAVGHHDTGGDLEFVSWIAEDVTVRRAQQEELRKTRQLLQAVFDSIREGIFVVDERTREIRMCNPAVEDIFGYKPQELIGSTTRQLHLSDESFQRNTQLSSRGLSYSGSFRAEHELRHRSGKTIFTENQFTRLGGGDVLEDAFIVVTRDVTQRRQSERRMAEYTARLQHLSHQVMVAQENERRRMARELHDQIGQQLTALKLGIESCRRDAGATATIPLLEGCEQVVTDLMDQVRDLSLRLRPTMLDDLGLKTTLEWFARRQTELTRARVDAEVGDLPEALSGETVTTCYRLVQEAVTNALKHGSPEHIQIRVEAVDDGLDVKVRDDGCGFDPDVDEQELMRAGHSGLNNIRERARLIGGRVVFCTEPGAGCTVSAWLPAEPHLPPVVEVA